MEFTAVAPKMPDTSTDDAIAAAMTIALKMAQDHVISINQMPHSVWSIQVENTFDHDMDLIRVTVAVYKG